MPAELLVREQEDQDQQPQKRKLPPGIVLGPDGKPCKVCTGFKAWSAAQSDPKPKPTSRPGNDVTQTTNITASNAVHAVPTDEPPPDCPADVNRLGRHTWTFLHTTAAYFPSIPTPAQKDSMLGLVSALPVLYPCHHCAEDLGEDLKANPPDVSSGERLSKWLCGMHNNVNRKLGKDEFDCSKVFERWRDGWKDGRCG